MSLTELPGPCQDRARTVLGDELLTYLSAPASPASFPELPEPSAPRDTGDESLGDTPGDAEWAASRARRGRKAGGAQPRFGAGVEMLQPQGEHAETELPAGSCLDSPAAASPRVEPTFLAGAAAGTGGSSGRIAASVSPWKQLRMLQSRAGLSPALVLLLTPLLPQEPLSGRRGGLSPSSIFPQESETLSLQGKMEMQSDRLVWSK